MPKKINRYSVNIFYERTSPKTKKREKREWGMNNVEAFSEADAREVVTARLFDNEKNTSPKVMRQVVKKSGKLK